MDAYKELAKSYDQLTWDVDYRAVVAFYFEILGREGLKPRTAVDLACGTGSVTRLLAERGLAVTGVDLSEEMLTAAMAKCIEMDRPPQFVRQDLRQLRLPRGGGSGGVRPGQPGLHHGAGGLRPGHRADLPRAESRGDLYF